MTRVATPGGDAAALQAREAARRPGTGGRHEDALSSRGHRHEAGEGLGRQDMRFGHPGTGENERQAQFLDSVRRALGEGRAASDEEPSTKRLLAVAGDVPPPLPSPFAVAAPASAEAPPMTPTTADRVEAIAADVEAAVRAERLARGGEGLSLRLDLGGAMPGVASLTIAMSSDIIEITLRRDGAEVPPDYALAAQGLADRLQARFAKRLVRVVETDAPDPAETRSGGGLGDIARLLSQRDERS